HGGTWGWNNGVWSCSRPNYYAWGNNQNGQYGNGTVVASYSPALVTLTVSQPMTSVAMSSSQYYACGVAENSMLWCWGTNQYGQLGIGSKSTNPHYEVS